MYDFLRPFLRADCNTDSAGDDNFFCSNQTHEMQGQNHRPRVQALERRNATKKSWVEPTPARLTARHGGQKERKNTLHRVLPLWWNNHLTIRRDDKFPSSDGRVWWTKLPRNLRATSSFRTAGFSLNFEFHFSTLVLFLSVSGFLVLDVWFIFLFFLMFVTSIPKCVWISIRRRVAPCSTSELSSPACW